LFVELKAQEVTKEVGRYLTGRLLTMSPTPLLSPVFEKAPKFVGLLAIQFFVLLHVSFPPIFAKSIKGYQFALARL